MSWVLGLEGGELKEVLEEVLILPGGEKWKIAEER